MAHSPSWHSHFSPSTMSLFATSLPHSQMCKVPKRTTLKVFVSLFSSGKPVLHGERQPSTMYLWGAKANSMALISTSVILKEVSTLGQSLFPMMLCKASTYRCFSGTDPEDHQPLAKSLTGDRGGEANMEKSQRKGKVSDGHNIWLAILMAEKRNKGGDGPGQSLRLNSCSHTNPKQLYPKFHPRDPAFSKSM